MLSLIQLLVSIVLIFLWIDVGVTYDLHRQAERIDDLELKLMTEGRNRRTDIFQLRKEVDKLKEQMKAFLDATESVTGQTEKIENKTPDTRKEVRQRDSSDTEEFSRQHQTLMKGFRIEKTLNSRARRDFSEIKILIENLQLNSNKSVNDIEMIKEILNRLERTANGTVTDQNIVLNQTQKIPKLSNEVSDIKDALKHYLQNVSRPKSCLELLQRGHVSSGVYKVYPGTWTEGIEVYCDQNTDDGGWIVFQRREDGFLDFYRGWIDYKLGFGHLLGEFWLGNEYLHHLASNCCHELRIDLADFSGNTRYAKYSNFMVGPKSGDYVLKVVGYSGDANDALSGHNGASFSTKDNGKSKGCSLSYKGGWWYTKCHSANLNGLYLHGNHTSYADGIEWRHWTGYHYSLKSVEMKFRERV